MIANCKKLTALVAALLSLFMLMSLCAISVSATETETETVEETTTETVEETTTESATESATESTTESTAATTAGTTTETTTTTTAVTEADKTATIRGLINLGVGAVILIVLAILAIKFRAKIPGWLKALKSECGKISWCSKDKLKKNTLVVVIVIIAIVISIAVLDFAFSKAVDMLISLF